MKKYDPIKSAYLDGFIAKHAQADPYNDYNPANPAHRYLAGSGFDYVNPGAKTPHNDYDPSHRYLKQQGLDQFTLRPGSGAQPGTAGDLIAPAFTAWAATSGGRGSGDVIGRAGAWLSQASKTPGIRQALKGVGGTLRLGGFLAKGMTPMAVTALSAPGALLRNYKTDKWNPDIPGNMQANSDMLNASVDSRRTYPGQVAQNAYNIVTDPVTALAQVSNNAGKYLNSLGKSVRGMGPGNTVNALLGKPVRTTPQEVLTKRYGLPANTSTNNLPSTTSPVQYPKMLSDKVTRMNKNSTVKGNAMNKYSESELSYLEGFVKRCEKYDVAPEQLLKVAAPYIPPLQAAGVDEVVGKGLSKAWPGMKSFGKGLWHHGKGLIPYGDKYNKMPLLGSASKYKLPFISGIKAIKPEGLMGAPVGQTVRNWTMPKEDTQKVRAFFDKQVLARIPKDVTLGKATTAIGTAAGTSAVSTLAGRLGVPPSVQALIPTPHERLGQITSEINPDDLGSYPAVSKLLKPKSPDWRSTEQQRRRATINEGNPEPEGGRRPAKVPAPVSTNAVPSVTNAPAAKAKSPPGVDTGELRINSVGRAGAAMDD